MLFREIPTGPVLAPHVESLWTLSSGQLDAPGGAGLVIPDGAVEIVFALDGTSAWVPGPDGSSSGAAHVLGLTTGPFQAEYRGRVDLFGIRLRPAAAIRIFRNGLAAIRDRAAPAGELAPALVRRVAGALCEPDEAMRIGVASALASVLEGRSRPEEDRVGRAMGAILAANGNISISELARDAGISLRHLDRCFDRYAGIGPKLFCRLARFRTAWRMGFSTRAPSWAAIAARCGYADQAHLCRDFREFSGITPGVAVAPS